MENKNQKPAEGGFVTNAFAQLLPTLEHGATQQEASAKLTELIQACALNNKPGKITLEITVEPTGSNAMNFSGDVKIKKPKVKPAKTLLFYDGEKGFALSKNNPAQHEMGFVKEVAKPDAEVRSVQPEQTEVRQVVNG